MKRNALLGSLAIIILGCIVQIGAFAEGKDVELRIGSSVSLSVPESTNLEIMAAGAGTFGSTYFDVTASTNSEHGYTLTMSTDKTYLESETIDPATGDNAVIEAIPYVSGGITADAFSATTDSNILDHWGISIGNTTSYNPIALSAVIKETSEEVTGDVTRINLASKATSALVPATYTTKMNFQLVANVVEPDEGTEFLCSDSTCSEDATDVTKSSTHLDGRNNNVTYAGGTFARAFEVAYVNADKSMYIPARNTDTGEYTGEYKEASIGRDYLGLAASDYRFAMQDMTSAICDAVTVEHDSLQLLDIRDGKSYWVTKLNDGHCWMTQDLALTLSKDTALDSTTSDLNSYGVKGYTADWGYTSNNGVITWTPSRNMREATYTERGYLAEKYDGYQYYSPSSVNVWAKNIYQVDEYFYHYTCDYLVGPYKCIDYFIGNPETKNEHRRMGNYYNWSAAVANNNTAEYTSNTMGDISNNPQNSICPKGWRLPTTAGADPTVAGSTDEFQRLRKVYSEEGDTEDQVFVEAPLYFNRGGVISDSCGSSGEECLNYAGYNVEYWSSTVYNNYSAYTMYGHTTTATSYYNRSQLRLVRCVAR